MDNNAVLLRAYNGEKTSEVPIWFMRQAGRYLPEYRELRAQHKMLDLIRNPELAAEVTLQPIRRFSYDGAIIFADILTPLIGMGIDLDFVEGEGPKISNPPKSARDIEALRVPDPHENVAYTLSAIEIASAELSRRGIPLLGFSGAPFTLSSYLLGDKGSSNLTLVKKIMRDEPDTWDLLQTKLSKLVGEYLVAQHKAGAQGLQIFDSWLGHLGPQEYERFVAPYLKEIVSYVRKHVTCPLIFFSTGTAGLMSKVAELDVNVFGIDWRVSLTDAFSVIGDTRTIQGNLDPSVLLGSWSYVQEEALRILEESRGLKAYVFNLGHGILPATPVDTVSKLVELVKDFKR